jgi:hypothetical protein
VLFSNLGCGAKQSSRNFVGMGGRCNALVITSPLIFGHQVSR